MQSQKHQYFWQYLRLGEWFGYLCVQQVQVYISLRQLYCNCFKPCATNKSHPLVTNVQPSPLSVSQPQALEFLSISRAVITMPPSAVVSNFSKSSLARSEKLKHQVYMCTYFALHYCNYKYIFVYFIVTTQLNQKEVYTVTHQYLLCTLQCIFSG